MNQILIPILNPLLNPNIKPNIEPYIELNNEPNIQPNIQPKIEPNIEPIFGPNIIWTTTTTTTTTIEMGFDIIEIYLVIKYFSKKIVFLRKILEFLLKHLCALLWPPRCFSTPQLKTHFAVIDSNYFILKYKSRST